MKKNNLIVILFMMLNLTQVIQLVDAQVVSQKKQVKTVVTDDQIRNLFEQLNKDFAQYESTNPQEGYCVTVQTIPVLQAKLTPYGGKRSTKLLSGMPKNESDYIKQCPFCQYSKDGFVDSRIVKKFNDKSYAVKSMNNQVLVIPDNHYDYIFSVPLEEQILLLKNIFLIRNDNLDKIERPIEFHCGSAAGQTIFHLHGRTGVYIK